MDLNAINISGFNGYEIKKLFKQFIEQETELDPNSQEVRPVPKQLSSLFISSTLDISTSEADSLLKEIIKEGYLDPTKLVPTTSGMALAHANGLPRIMLSKAYEILSQLVGKAEEINKSGDFEVLIDEILLFGSVKEAKKTVGDIDLLVIYQKPLGNYYLPEHLYEEEDISELLQTISPYLSFHSEFDAVVDEACKMSVFKNI